MWTLVAIRKGKGQGRPSKLTGPWTSTWTEPHETPQKDQDPKGSIDLLEIVWNGMPGDVPLKRRKRSQDCASVPNLVRSLTFADDNVMQA